MLTETGAARVEIYHNLYQEVLEWEKFYGMKWNQEDAAKRARVPKETLMWMEGYEVVRGTRGKGEDRDVYYNAEQIRLIWTANEIKESVGQDKDWDELIPQITAAVDQEKFTDSLEWQEVVMDLAKDLEI